MSRKYYRYDKDKKKMVEFDINKQDFSNRPISDYINMRKTLSGTTKIEFNSESMQDSIDRMNK